MGQELEADVGFQWIIGESVTDVYRAFLSKMQESLVPEADLNRIREVSPRGSTTLELKGLAVSTYLEPAKRVLFCPVRDANPFFHFMESLWMLAGRNDVAFPAQFASNIRNYSDDGETLHGAYGARWRHIFGGFPYHDQLDRVEETLRKDPDSRRAVLAMWIPAWDDPTSRAARDLCCNTHVYFKIREGRLHMTVLCRSNDACWGAYGANAVHFSVLQEYLARRLEAGLGPYRQVSDSLHVYKDNEVWQRVWGAYQDGQEPPDWYGQVDRYGDAVEPYPLMEDPDAFDSDLNRFFHGAEPLEFWLKDDSAPARFHEPFWRHVFLPMLRAWFERKERGRDHVPYPLLEQIHATDWRLACTEWCERRSPRIQNEEPNLGYR